MSLFSPFRILGHRFLVIWCIIVSFFILFEIADTNSCFRSQKLCPFLHFSHFRTQFYVFKPAKCILFFRFSKLRTQIHASAAKSCVLFYTFHIFGHSIRHFPNRYMRSQNKIDVSITSWRQGARWSRPAASDLKRRRRRLLFDKRAASIIPGGAPLLRPWLACVVFHSQGSGDARNPGYNTAFAPARVRQSMPDPGWHPSFSVARARQT